MIFQIQIWEMKKALFVVATVSAAPALTFDRPASTKVNHYYN